MENLYKTGTNGGGNEEVVCEYISDDQRITSNQEPKEKSFHTVSQDEKCARGFVVAIQAFLYPHGGLDNERGARESAFFRFRIPRRKTSGNKSEV